MSIVFEKVSKAFGTKEVLRNVSFEVKKGEILFILGKSGMGKSVTLKHIVGVLKPDSGNVWVDQQNVTSLDSFQLTQIRRRCGMVFQHPALLDSLSVFDNVAFGLRTPQYQQTLPTPLTEKQIEEAVVSKLQLVHLGTDILKRFPQEISYGMQKRVSLARTLAPAPEYLLFDEPTTGLDPITTEAVNSLIKDLSHTLKVTSVVVSHDMACALKIADRVLVLDRGGILAHDSVAEIRRSKEPLIRDFLSETVSLEAQLGASQLINRGAS
ncbi:MAG: ATP-binding cassette domain-containing protein [Bdellovibrio sp.]|nr:ATP-binding cassette domain-containing protein [Bdellovibrio sp.]